MGIVFHRSISNNMVLPTVDECMEAFDECDTEETEFVPRLDLRKHLDSMADAKYPLVAELAAQIKALDVMIVERDDFEEMVEEWLPGAQTRDVEVDHHADVEVEVSVKIKAPMVSVSGSISIDDLMEAFDHCDEDETGFAPRLDLRIKLEEMANSGRPHLQALADLVRELDTMILERDDFEAMAGEWHGSADFSAHAEVKVKAPSIEIKVKAPSIEIKVKAPSIEVKVKAPEVHVEVKVKAPDFGSSSLGFEVKVKAPAVKVKAPSIEIKVKAPAVHVEVKVKAPDFGSSSLGFEVKVKAPAVKVKAPSIEIKVKAPAVHVEVKVKAPDFGSSSLGFDGGSSSLGFEVEVKAPSVEIKAPVVDWDAIRCELEAELRCQMDASMDASIAAAVSHATAEMVASAQARTAQAVAEAVHSANEACGVRCAREVAEALKACKSPAKVAISAEAVFDAHVDQLTKRARAKFHQLDRNKNGLLEGEELAALGNWVWSSFHPGSKLSEADKQAEGAKILCRQDMNEDGAMSYEEFEGWFKKTCTSIEKFRRGLVDKRPPIPIPAAAIYDAHVDKLVRRAHKKFDQLDKNGNGLLEGEELTALGDWVWSSFHPGQDSILAAQELEGAKILGRLDANSDGAMSFEEFEGWFRKTCASIEKYRRGLSQRSPQAEPAAEAPCEAEPLDAPHVLSAAEMIEHGRSQEIHPYLLANGYVQRPTGDRPTHGYGYYGEPAPLGLRPHGVPHFSPTHAPVPHMMSPPRHASPLSPRSMVPLSFVPPMGVRSMVPGMNNGVYNGPASPRIGAPASPAERIYAAYYGN